MKYLPSFSNSRRFKKERGRPISCRTSQPGSVELRWKSTVSGRRCIRARRRRSWKRASLEAVPTPTFMSSSISTCSNFDPRGLHDICYLTTPRWKTLTISESDDMHPDAGPTGDEVLKTISRYDDLQFLRLHELHITDYRSNAALEADEELRFKPTWSFPKLRILCCKGFVPTPSASFSSISSFSTAVYILPLFYADQLEEIFTFLTSTPTVTDLDLQMDGLSSCRMSEPFTARRVNVSVLSLP